MNWDDYRYFLAVARSGQLSAAGTKMGVDHATVSRRVKSLETQLKTKLFDSSPQGYVLTREGEKLLALAEQMESATIQAEGAIQTGDNKLSGIIRVGVPDGLAAYVVTDAAKELGERHPSLQIQLIAIPQKFSLSKREVDFTITVSRPNAGRAKTRKISDYQLHLYGSKTYLENAPQIKSKADLKDHLGIGYVPEFIYDKELDYIPLIDPEFRLQLTSTSVHVQLQAILKGSGIGVVHDFMAKQHEELVPILKNEISITRNFWLTVHEDYANVDRVRISIDTVVKHIKMALRDI